MSESINMKVYGCFSYKDPIRVLWVFSDILYKLKKMFNNPVSGGQTSTVKEILKPRKFLII